VKETCTLHNHHIYITREGRGHQVSVGINTNPTWRKITRQRISRLCRIQYQSHWCTEQYKSYLMIKKLRGYRVYKGINTNCTWRKNLQIYTKINCQNHSQQQTRSKNSDCYHWPWQNHQEEELMKTKIENGGVSH
jgi:hypothetical protein